MRQNGEPSVEEILHSIKQVIARDQRTVAPVERSRRVVAETVENVIPEPEIVPADDVFELPETALIDPVAQPVDQFDEPAALDNAGEPSLIREETRDSMRDSLAALAMLSEPGVPPQIVRSGETSLESLARELLRPALAEWLDKNLPQLVERMVASEIAKIVGKRG